MATNEVSASDRSSLDSTAAGPEAVAAMVRRLAFEAPGLSDLTPEQLDRVAQAVIVRDLADDLQKRAQLERIDYRAERENFLANASRTKSENTQASYTAALNRLDAWAAKRGVRVVEMRPKDADDFVYMLRTQGRAGGSVRVDVAGASSFFTYLERRFEQIRNPFRGTKARPENLPVRKLAYPTGKEVETVLAAVSDRADFAAFSILAHRGLRVGILASLSIKGTRFIGRSKGKSISGELPQEALAAIAAAGLDLKAPFKDDNARALAARFRYITERLAVAGRISAVFSVHDLRHSFAVENYRQTRDVYAVKELLGHSSIQVTEFYLKGMGLV